MSAKAHWHCRWTCTRKHQTPRGKCFPYRLRVDLHTLAWLDYFKRPPCRHTRSECPYGANHPCPVTEATGVPKHDENGTA